MENTTTQRETVQTIYFPNVSNVNCQNTVIVRTNLRGHIQDNGKRCNILSKIPVNVNQDDVLFYKPENPFRANLGQGNSVSRIDIRLTDRDDNILDFNGVPNEIGLVFEVFDVVSIPIIRHNEHRIPTDKTDITSAHFGKIYDTGNRESFSGFKQIDQIENAEDRMKRRVAENFVRSSRN